MNFDNLIEKLNCRKASTGWHSQLLENESTLKATTMAMLFTQKVMKLNRPVTVPAICVSMAVDESVFVFRDSSEAVIPNHLIC